MSCVLLYCRHEPFLAGEKRDISHISVSITCLGLIVDVRIIQYHGFQYLRRWWPLPLDSYFGSQKRSQFLLDSLRSSRKVDCAQISTAMWNTCAVQWSGKWRRVRVAWHSECVRGYLSSCWHECKGTQAIEVIGFFWLFTLLCGILVPMKLLTLEAFHFCLSTLEWFYARK